MGLYKGILLGAGAAMVSVAAAQAADLPVRKAAPVEYVRICDAYGSGFFFIPGTETCLRVSGRVRADYAFVPAQDLYSGVTATGRPIVSTPADAEHVMGWEARARIGVDVRTRTAWGTVRAVGVLRMSRTTGVLEAVAEATGGGGGADSTLEAAYIQFAGFTFGAARDNFAMMPSNTFGAGHWGSFANGAKQLAYTFTFGGGLSATIALQDYEDTNNGTVRAPLFGFNAPPSAYYVYNSVPQVNARLEWDQSWGSITVAGAFANLPFVNATPIQGDPSLGGYNPNPRYDQDENVWAIGGAVKINLPMLARGSAMWLHAAYADGMTEYTINWVNRKTSAYQRDVGGFVNTAPSVVLTATGIDTIKSWNVAAMLEHYWAPQWRSTFWGSYGQLDAPASAANCGWGSTGGGNGCIGDAKVWNVGTNLIWEPVRNFELGVEVIYARVDQDVRYLNAWQLGSTVFDKSEGNVTGRLRVERNF